MSVKIKSTLLASIVHNLEILDAPPDGVSVADIMADIDQYVDRLYITEPGISKVRVNWAATERNRLGLHIFIFDVKTNTMVIFQGTVSPGFIRYSLDVAYYAIHGASYFDLQWRNDMKATIEAQLREQLG